jgi:hypothetical protein
LGVAFAALRTITGADLFRPEATHAAMPVAEPDLTAREVRADAARLLPGARVQRLLFLAVPAALAQAARPVFGPDPDRACALTRSVGGGTAHQRPPSGSPARAAARHHGARCGR